MAYTDYSYYKDEYLGVAIAEVDFNRLALRASEYIDNRTGGLSKTYEDTGSLLKSACCAVAEQIQINEQGGEVASQTVGPWSKTYVKSGKTAEQSMYDCMDLYLASTGLLSRWV